MEFAKILGIISATFVSEDLTCISTGLLIRTGKIALVSGVLACLIGIFVGDLLLFLLGRLAARAISSRKKLPLAKIFQGVYDKYLEHKYSLSQRFTKEGWKLIILARFVPGLRLPVYFGAGFIGGKFTSMIIWALLAGVLWTPALVLLSTWLGDDLQKITESLVGSTWLAFLLSVLVFYFSIRFLFLIATQDGRRKFLIFFRKLGHIEFLTPWLFYIPMLPGWLYWCIRYNSLFTLSAANPAIEHGGLLGESKSAILKLLGPGPALLDCFVIPSHTTIRGEKKRGEKNQGIKNSPLKWRLELLEKKAKQKKAWQFPIVIKPDKGQRGRGVRIIYNMSQAKAYLKRVPQTLIAQAYDPGPFEAGIFYYRKPSQKQGRIFSITDKIFPILSGDGKTSLKDLIWKHPRYSLQANVFIKRIIQKKISPDRILKKGEIYKLALVGNHVQGTMFCDGAELYSSALEKKIDKIAKKMRGFYIGRFDIRYKSREALKRGLGFRIIEVNGASSESTNIYDPSFGFFKIYGILYRQWQLLVEIAYENRNIKGASTSPFKLIKMIIEYLKAEKPPVLSD